MSGDSLVCLEQDTPDGGASERRRRHHRKSTRQTRFRALPQSSRRTSAFRYRVPWMGSTLREPSRRAPTLTCRGGGCRWKPGWPLTPPRSGAAPGSTCLDHRACSNRANEDRSVTDPVAVAPYHSLEAAAKSVANVVNKSGGFTNRAVSGSTHTASELSITLQNAATG